MSIDVQTEIRNTCLYEGGHFAVLMAMADCANTTSGEGIYPGIDLLAANARLKQRRTQDIIKELRADGVVVLVDENGEDVPADVQPMGGRGKKTEYRIDLERVQELQGLHEAEPGTCAFCAARRKREIWRAEARARKGAIFGGKGAKNGGKGAISDTKGAISSTHIEEPSEPSKEPSEEPLETPRPARVEQVSFPDMGSPEASKPSVKPKTKVHDPDLVAAYETYNAAAERLNWARCQMRTPARDSHLRKRLSEAGGIEGWRVALATAEASDFLCGRAPPRGDRSPFKMDIDFLLQQSSFVKLMEGKYDNRSGGSSSGPNGHRTVRDAARAVAERLNGGAPD